ncbi:MAG: hypothetical protein ACOCPM_07145 [Bacteroidales bacterium]
MIKKFEYSEFSLYFYKMTDSLQKKHLLIILMIFCLWPVSHKGATAKGFYEKENYTQHLDSLRDTFSYKKTIPGKYELECLIALSFYPELKDVSIEFVDKNIKTTMAARPRADAIFKQQPGRVYRIFINNNVRDSIGLSYDKVPFNARIGIIGHELAHIVDYENKSIFQIMLNGIAYISSSTFRKNFEKDIDQITIDRGLGYQLYAFSDFLFHKADVNPAYLDFKKKNYPLPKNYRTWLIKHPEYTGEVIDQIAM